MSMGVLSRVLLVEDNPRDAELTIRALKRSGLVADIVHLKDGEQALDFCLRGGPNNVFMGQLWFMLLDLKLPKLSGLEVLRALKSDLRIRTMPVVLFTSSRELSDIEESYRLGVNSYVVKPAAYRQLEGVIYDTAKYWLTINQRPPVSTGTTDSTHE